MKKIIPLFAFALILHLAASAAVPLKWTVETSRAVPAQFEAYKGETLTFEAALQSYGKPLEAPMNYSLYWQTNGMGNAWWSQEVVGFSGSGTMEGSNSTVPLQTTTTTNVLFATWSPTNDVGAKVYNCFIGKPGTIYHAAFQLRLRPSPGATPNELPLPQKVIDFAKVTVLNPPWSGGGGGGGVDTNAVIDIIHKTVDGSARQLPKYLHALDFCDSYPEAAKEYYHFREVTKMDGGCSSVRNGGFLYRNFDYPFDDRAEFIVRTVAAPATGVGNRRFASVGVAQVGTNLTEAIVTSGKPSRCYKWLPGATVDGINENGVACNINVVDGNPQTSGWHTTGDLHPLAAVRWILDNATNAQHGAEYIEANIRFPAGWTQNFHYMVADATSTYIVENGEAYPVPSRPSATGVDQPVLTNFRLYPTRDTSGEGQERYDALVSGASITSQWWTLTYTPTGYRASDLPGITGQDLTNLLNYWSSKPKESHRGEIFGDQQWWQTVHTSIYNIENRTLRIAVQETDDWYTFAVDQANVDLGPIEEQITSLASSVSGLESSKLDKAGGTVTGGVAFDSDSAGSPVLRFMSSYGTATDIQESPYGLQFIGDPISVLSWDKIKLDGEIPLHIPGHGQTLREYVEGHHDADKRDLTDNEAHADSFGEWDGSEAWDFLGISARPIYKSDSFGDDHWKFTFDTGYDWYSTEEGTPEYLDSLSVIHFDLHKVVGGDYVEKTVEVTRAKVATSGESYTTHSFVTNAVNAAVSTNNPAFVSAVRSIAQPSSPSLRVYDEIRQCWWIGRMVNGVINWEVE